MSPKRLILDMQYYVKPRIRELDKEYTQFKEEMNNSPLFTQYLEQQYWRYSPDLNTPIKPFKDPITYYAGRDIEGYCFLHERVGYSTINLLNYFLSWNRQNILASNQYPVLEILNVTSKGLATTGINEHYGANRHTYIYVIKGEVTIQTKDKEVILYPDNDYLIPGYEKYKLYFRDANAYLFKLEALDGKEYIK